LQTRQLKFGNKTQINQAKSELIKEIMKSSKMLILKKVREIDDYYENEELKKKANETEKYNILK
jgi:hypothetical protein